MSDSNSDERKFLHDLSNPLGVAFGMVEILLDSVKAGQPLTPQEHERLTKALKSLQRTTELIQARRDAIIQSEKKAA